MMLLTTCVTTMINSYEVTDYLCNYNDVMMLLTTYVTTMIHRYDVTDYLCDCT